MARKKIREYDSKGLLKEHLKRLSGIDLEICSAQVTQWTDFAELTNKEPWLSSTKLVVKPDMLFGKRGKSGLVALNLDLAQVAAFVKERLGIEVEMGGCRAPITTFVVEPFVPHDQEYYLSMVSERLGCTISFSECGGIEIDENWDKVKTIFLPTEKPMTLEACAPLIATLPLEVRGKMGDFIIGVFSVFQDLDFGFLEMNPFTLVNGEPYPLDMRGELDDTAAFENFMKWGDVEFPLPFGRVLSPTESFIHSLDEKVGDLGYASELGNYAEYSGAPDEDEVLQYARVVIDCATADPDGRKRALLIGGGIANFTDVAATFNGIIRALKEKESKLKAARMHLYVRRGGPNYQTGLARMRALGEELGVPIEWMSMEEELSRGKKRLITPKPLEVSEVQRFQAQVSEVQRFRARVLADLFRARVLADLFRARVVLVDISQAQVLVDLFPAQVWDSDLRHIARFPGSDAHRSSPMAHQGPTAGLLACVAPHDKQMGFLGHIWNILLRDVSW